MADPVRDFSLDDDGDLAVANGDRVLVAGRDAVKQGCQVKAKVFLGEIYLNQSIGVDYLNKILIKNPDPLVVREQIRARLLAVPDVLEVVGSQLTIDSNRAATITYQIRDAYSETPVSDSVTVVV